MTRGGCGWDFPGGHAGEERRARAIGKRLVYNHGQVLSKIDFYNSILVCLSIWFFGQGLSRADLKLSLASKE